MPAVEIVMNEEIKEGTHRGSRGQVPANVRSQPPSRTPQSWPSGSDKSIVIESEHLLG